MQRLNFKPCNEPARQGLINDERGAASKAAPLANFTIY